MEASAVNYKITGHLVSSKTLPLSNIKFKSMEHTLKVIREPFKFKCLKVVVLNLLRVNNFKSYRLPPINKFKK